MISGSWDNTLRVWDLATWETKTTLQGPIGPLVTVAVAPDRRYAISSWDRTLRVWDLATGETKTTLRGHTSPVVAVAVTPDSCYVISGSRDNTLRVWDLTNGREIITFTLDTTVMNCSVAKDDGTIVAGDIFGRLHFLQLVEADRTKPPIGETKIRLLSGKE